MTAKHTILILAGVLGLAGLNAHAQEWIWETDLNSSEVVIKDRYGNETQTKPNLTPVVLSQSAPASSSEGVPGELVHVGVLSIVLSQRWRLRTPDLNSPWSARIISRMDDIPSGEQTLQSDGGILTGIPQHYICVERYQAYGMWRYNDTDWTSSYGAYHITTNHMACDKLAFRTLNSSSPSRRPGSINFILDIYAFKEDL